MNHITLIYFILKLLYYYIIFYSYLDKRNHIAREIQKMGKCNVYVQTDTEQLAIITGLCLFLSSSEWYSRAESGDEP